MTLLKHVGEITTTGSRCAIVFLQIPNDPEHTLIVYTDNLPDRYHQAVQDVINSPEGQNAANLGEVLSRRIMPDTGKSILETLHSQGFLSRMTIDNVALVPRPGERHKLRDVLTAMGALEAKPKAENFFTEQQEVAKNESTTQIAKGLLAQAQLMIDDAKRIQEQAYKLDSSLRPTQTVVSTPVVETKAKTRKPKVESTE